jgi:multidrug efflux system outer membrane protein
MSRYLLLFPLLLASCTVGPHYQEPNPNAPDAFASKPGSATTAVESQWWKRFNDAQLNAVVVQAEQQNRDLKLAEARLKEARALWTQARLDLLPTVRSGAGYTNGQVSKARSLSGESIRTELYEAGLDATWELDLVGRVRRSVKAAKATEEAVAAERDALLIALRAEVASNYLLLRGTQAQLEAAQRNAANQAESLRIAEASLQGGRGTQLDVARANAQWNGTLSTLPQFETTIDQTIHRIAVLCGVAPSDLRVKLASHKPLPNTPATVALSKPAEALRHRPDIRVAERNLAAATERVGVATADLFPRVTFNGTVGLEGQTLSAIGKSGAGAYSFGPHLSWAAFDLGRVKQQIIAADARAEGSLALYEQTVLQALEEAENALTAYAREQARLQYLREAEKSAEEAAKLASQRYKDGVANFLDVLDAERVALVAQNETVESQTRVATAWVSVYKAMGGGWSNSN